MSGGDQGWGKKPVGTKKRGRRRVSGLGPWLEQMDVYVGQGMVRTKAARIIVERHGSAIPRGSVHGERTVESTITLLVRRYKSCKIKQQKYEEKQVVQDAIMKAFTEQTMNVQLGPCCAGVL
jgi:hypothetical protein